MSKRVLAILVAALLAIGIFGAVANAGVEGDFTFYISIYPEELGNKEVQPFVFDFEGKLLLDFTISGLTFGNNVAVGLAGVEHYILSLTTTLGALDVNDQFWFATPYNNLKADIGDLLFVKKRVDAVLSLGGLTMETLVMFEDINFPVPPDCGGWPYGCVPSTLTAYAATDQDFEFGACITLSGTTVSGIRVESETGINADCQLPNMVKKYYQLGAVQSNALEFTAEKISVTGISIGGIVIDTYLEFRPALSFSLTTDVSFSLFDIVDVFIELHTEDITKFGAFDLLTYTISWGDVFRMVIYDNNANMILDAGDQVYSYATLAIQGATLAVELRDRLPGGFYYGRFTMTIPVSIGTLTARLQYSGTPMVWDYFYFKIASDIAGLGFNMWSTWDTAGFTSAGIELEIPFSV